MTDLRPLLPPRMQIRDLQRICGFKSYSQFWCVVTGRSRATAEVAVRISAATGIPKSIIRPDLWPPRKNRRVAPAA